MPRLWLRRARHGALAATLVGVLLSISHASGAPAKSSRDVQGAPSIVCCLVLTIFMMASAGGPRASWLSIGNKRPRRDFTHSPTLASVHKDTAWADTILPKGVTYAALASQLDSMLAFAPTFDRPPPKAGKKYGEDDDTQFIQPLHKRLVKVDSNRLDHFLDAITKYPPAVDARRGYALPQACKHAIAFMLQKAKTNGLLGWRLRQLEDMLDFGARVRIIGRPQRPSLSTAILIGVAFGSRRAPGQRRVTYAFVRCPRTSRR